MLVQGGQQYGAFPFSKAYLAITNQLSCKIFEHFAILPDPVTEFLKLGSALHKQGTILAPKQVDPLPLWNKQIHPFHLDKVSSPTQIQ